MVTLKNPAGFNAQSVFTTILMLAVIAMACGYAYFQAQDLIAGPAIEFTSPEDNAIVTEPVITVTGVAERIAFLELNERQIYINETGVFEEKLILSPGVNIIKLEAQDRFGRDVTRQLHVFFEED